MGLFQLVLKQMRQRALGTWLTTVSILLSVALWTAVYITYRESGKVFGQTEYGYDVIVGPKGSKLQLVLNTVYHLDVSPGNVPYSVYEGLANPGNRFVRSAVPYGVGDTYKGHRIVGTLPKLFGVDDEGKPLAADRTFEYRPGQRYEMAQGRAFHPEKFEAVIGSEVAQRLGMSLGSKFKATHGQPDEAVAASHEHEHEWEVVGVLKPTQTANDAVLFIPLVSFFAIADHGEGLKAQSQLRQMMGGGAGAAPGGRPAGVPLGTPVLPGRRPATPGGAGQISPPAPAPVPVPRAAPTTATKPAEDHDHDHDHDHGHGEEQKAAKPQAATPAKPDEHEHGHDHDHEHEHEAPAKSAPENEGQAQQAAALIKQDAGHDHDHDYDHAPAKAPGKAPAAAGATQQPAHEHGEGEHAGDDHSDHEHPEHFHVHDDGTIHLDLPKEAWMVSAILVKSRGGVSGQQLMYMINNSPLGMAVSPAMVMREFFDTFLKGSAMLLLGLAALVTVVAAVSILVSIYNAVSARQREIAIQRALGATRGRILTQICLEAALIGLLGGVLGLILGHILAGVGSVFFRQTVGERIDWITPSVWEGVYLLGVVAVAILAGLVPGLKAYRTPVATNLVAV